MTFSPHAKVFFGRAENFLIYSDSEKARFIKNCGVKRLYQIPFDRDFSEIEPERFVKRLIEDLQVKHLLIGDDFRFGYRGRGNFRLLCKLCSDYGVSVANTPTITYKSARVSSSRVRRAIEAADFAKVGHLLGRDLSYRGEVIAGNQLGRTIGFATANIQLPRSRLLPDGVFVVKVNIEGDEKSYYGMANIGTKPTVDNSDRRQIETHIFDFCENLYEKTIVVTPLVKLRDE
ncbi:MAG: bifunctional riboflavin kinase/FMN adenylyltransferase, partial [Gammaproteobacteria bacterium]